MRKFFKGKSTATDPTTSAAPETGSSMSSGSNSDQQATSLPADNTDDAEGDLQSRLEKTTLDEDLRARSSYKSSLFSSNPTFDSFSTTPSSKPSSRQHHGKSRNDVLSGGAPLKQIDEQAEMSSFFFQEQEEGSNRVGGFLGDDIGRPLRVTNADLYNEMSTTSSSKPVSSSQRRYSDDNDVVAVDENFEVLQLEKNLTILNGNLVELIDQLNDDSINISKATVSMIDLLESFSFPNVSLVLKEDDLNLKKLVKFFLQFHDYHLRFEVYLNSKKLIIRKFIEFLSKLGINFGFDANGTIPFLRNFPIPLQDGSTSSSSISKVEKILNKVSNSSSSAISDQQGSFIAPILRGLSDSTSIISIMFGVPDPQPEHYEIIDVLYQSFPEIHFFIVKDFIKPCNDTSAVTEEKLYKFKPPFKLPNFKSPEISISISSENSVKSSGTLGCYLQPNIPSDLKDSNLLKYKDSKFALTCAHVLLSEMTNKKDSEVHYPKVQAPSKVLVNSYKNALVEQSERYPSDSIEYKSFQAEIKNCENQYNLNLGQVIWGERVLIHNKISDLAIVKIDNFEKNEVTNSLLSNNQSLIKDTGSSSSTHDLPLHLNFKNSKVVKVIPKSQFHKHSKVFKIGSSTNYTTGSINGIKMIYWLEGHLQTSEFVVSSSETFANAGDSGSLILNDLNDQFGLGSIGMLHSFDGELKQLGLFSTMEDIVERLKDITGVQWDLV